VAFGEPVTQVGWEQECLVAVAGKEVVGHGRSYAISLLCCLIQQPSLQQAGTRQLGVLHSSNGRLPISQRAAAHILSALTAGTTRRPIRAAVAAAADVRG
jgi:hypothetical protein